MKNLISWLKYSAFRNPHSAIGKRGFTLIEIIVLIVMAGILIPVIVIPFATGIRGSTNPEMATTAMYLAHQRMEELMKLEYTILIANSYTGSGLTAISNAPISNYKWQWEVRHATNANLFPLPAPDVDTGYMRIFVRVTDPGGSTYDVYSVVTNFP